MKQTIIKSFFVIYMQIGVNVIGLPELLDFKVPEYGQIEVKKKFHK